MDKATAVLNYLLTCPSIQKSPVFFNFIKAANDNKQFITVANDRAVNRTYVDGSIQKRYTFTLIDFKSVTYIPVVLNRDNENIDDMLDVQAIITWIDEQSELRNFPDFGPDCVVENIRTTTDHPNLNSVDTTVSPALARYSISIVIDYIDKSKAIWN